MSFKVHKWSSIAGAAVLLALTSAVACAQDELTASNLTDVHVQKAIDALVETLYTRKHPQRFWEFEKVPSGESTRQGGGYTALTVLALLQAGQSYQDPRLRDAVEYLSSSEMKGTYAITLRASLWAALPPRFHDNLVHDTRTLLEGFNEKTGGWDYVPNPRANYHDNSIRQFGALALWEADKRDVNIDRRYWQRLEDTFIQLQHADGGWNYKGESPATGSMTAAGLATLFITQDLLHANEAIRIGARSPSRHQKSIDLGMAWMDRHFSPTENPGKDTYFYYYLYGVERVGLASGYKFFGGQDWFREGAAELIHRLLKWDEASQTFQAHSKREGRGNGATIHVGDQAFALMFLTRGRVPVAFNKLEFAGAWNNRPRDAANLTQWIAENSESHLNWQIVNFNHEPQTWLDAAILYIASHEALPWIRGIDANAYVQQVRQYLDKRGQATGALEETPTPPTPPDVPELAKLKRYLDLGGMILAVNESNTKAFADSIERAGLLMYPQYEWRTLADDHWAYTAHTPIAGRRMQLRGLSNGVRELIILSPGGDLSATFQKRDTKQLADYQTAANIYYYASELNRPRPRLAAHVPQPIIARKPQATATIVRALHEGNWKPEPQALEAFAAAMTAKGDVDINIIDRPLTTIHEVSPSPTLVIVNGLDAHEFTPAQLKAINSYISSGGVILFETPGGRGAFTESAEQMAESQFDKPIHSVLRSRIITGDELSNAADLTHVQYRPFSLHAFGTRETSPRLRGMALHDETQPQLLFSREDISNALLDQPVWGVNGYAPQSAHSLLANIVRYALQLRQQPTK